MQPCTPINHSQQEAVTLCDLLQWGEGQLRQKQTCPVWRLAKTWQRAPSHRKELETGPSVIIGIIITPFIWVGLTSALACGLVNSVCPQTERFSTGWICNRSHHLFLNQTIYCYWSNVTKQQQINNKYKSLVKIWLPQTLTSHEWEKLVKSWRQNLFHLLVFSWDDNGPSNSMTTIYWVLAYM